MSSFTPHPDRTTVVTGASSGIGADIARTLAGRGYGVTLVARRAERLKALAEELTTNRSVRAEVVTADLTDEASRARLVEEIAARDVHVDGLVNNAGLSTWGPVAGSTPEAELRMVHTNVDAVVDLCTRFLPGMVERGEGAILNVASTAAFQPLPGQSGYAATKAFVLAYTQGLQGEFRGTGVTATVLCPGPVETEFGDVAGIGDDEAENALPKFMWKSSAEVAEAAVDGMVRGKAVVIPGSANAVAAQLARHVPRSLLIPILARQHPSLKSRD